MASDDGILSPEEIDALLKEIESGKGPTRPEAEAAPQPVKDGSLAERIEPGREGELSPAEMDAIGEIGNISMGAAATALSKVLNHKVEITTPRVSLVTHEGLRTGSPRYCIIVNVEYVKGLTGINIFLLKPHDAAVIGNLMMGGDGINVADELDEVALSAVAECMNQMMGSAATAVASLLSRRIEISPPVTRLIDLEKDAAAFDLLGKEDPLVQVAFDLTVEGLLQSQFYQIIPLEFARRMIEGVYQNTVSSEEVATSMASVPEYSKPAAAAAARGRAEVSRQPSTPLHSAVVSAAPQPNQQPVSVQPAQFAPLTPQVDQRQMQNIQLLMDVSLPVTVELGRTKMLIKDILELGKGSLIELEKFAGEPVDILINGKLIARGEVVVIDENFGVKVVDILSPVERLNGLQ